MEEGVEVIVVRLPLLTVIVGATVRGAVARKQKEQSSRPKVVRRW